MIKSGVAYTTSETNPEWNVAIPCLVGGFEMPDELQKELDKLKIQYGDLPKDLIWGYHKD